MNTTTIVSPSKLNEIDDPMGAMIFIAVVLLWYSVCFVFLMAMSDEGVEYSKRISYANPQREILRELVDKEKRGKLWDIYLGTSGDMNERITRAEGLRIRNIQRQLTMIDHQNDETHSPYRASLWSSARDVSSLQARVRVRRRSSVDRRILDEWHMLSDQLKAHGNWPWRIQKLFIRQHLRRQQRYAECQSAP